MQATAAAIYPHLVGFWSTKMTVRRIGMAMRLGDHAGDQALVDLTLGGVGEVELHRWVIGPGGAVLYPARASDPPTWGKCGSDPGPARPMPAWGE